MMDADTEPDPLKRTSLGASQPHSSSGAVWSIRRPDDGMVSFRSPGKTGIELAGR